MTYAIDGSDDCFAEIASTATAAAAVGSLSTASRDTTSSKLKYRSCKFVDIGPAAVAARDVVFNTGGAEFDDLTRAETWAVGQVVRVTNKNSGGPNVDCRAAGGTFKVIEITTPGTAQRVKLDALVVSLSPSLRSLSLCLLGLTKSRDRGALILP